MVVTAGHHTHEAAFRFQGHGPAVGGEGELRDDAVQALLAGLLRGLADHHHFRVGEAHRGDCGRFETPRLAGNDFRHHFALGHGPVGQHRLAGHIANGPDVAHAGLAAFIDGHCRAVHLQVQAFEVEALGARTATDRDQHLVGLQAQLPALAVVGQQATVLVAFDAVAQVQGDAQFLHRLGHRLGQLAS